AAIDSARAAYDALSDDAKLFIGNYPVLPKAEAALPVIALIDAIPTQIELLISTKHAIEDARAAYDALTADQKALVTNYQKLTDAENAWALIYAGHEDEMLQAEAVAALIEAIPDPVVLTSECENAINLANDAFSQLSGVQKAMLDESLVQKLTDAVATYKVLADQDAAEAVIARIDAIPSPVVYSAECKEAISDARAAYDALSDEAKALIAPEKLQALTDAEAAYAAYAAEIEFNVAFLGKEQSVLYEETIALTKLPKGAPDENGWAFDHWEVMPTPMYAGLHLKAVYRYLITLLPQAYDTLMYNGLAQTLIAAGEAEEGHLEYRIGEGAWSTELPKATDAGAYAIQYKLVREGHEDFIAPDTVYAQIAKAPVAYIAPVAYDTLVYNYAEQTLVIAGQTEDGTFEYTLTPTNENSWSTILSQGMNAGTYNVYFRVIGDMNHLDSVAPNPVAVSIAKRDIIVTAPVAYDTLVYNALAQTLAADAIADFSTPLYSLTPDNIDSWTENMVTGVNAGDYKVYYRVPGDDNHNDFETDSITVSIAKAPLTITANDTAIIYADAVPEFEASYSGWYGQDGADLISGLQFTTPYVVGSYVGTYDIVPSGATADNYTMTYVNGTLTVNKAHVYVSGAEAHKAKFADGHAIADVTKQGILNGIKLNDPIAHVTTAAFSSAEVAENLDITLFYELTGDAALLNNYYLDPTSEIFTHEGVIIEPFLPDNDDAPEDEEATVEEGIEVYAYGYCDGEDYKLKYHLNSGYPNQYKIEFEDSRFTNVDWTTLTTTGRDGTIDINIPVDLPTGDYKMTVIFRDSLYDWLESEPFNVTFHVNLPETYVVVLLDNTIALIDTCHCLTDVQWYHRNDASELWQPIEGATDRYYFENGGLTGEYFVKAKMYGVDTYTCPQTDVETLYDGGKHNKTVVRAYPSPAIDRVEVSIENSDVLTHMMTIVNMMGSEIEKRMFNGNKTTLDVSGYQSGNYMISVDGNVVKVIKK
ncbi:MAG: T9SS type A sorting domain-containing protein, partial [Paludibacteraceae bacterium]|nr:T9SS type A sorting domain-containing protein [Paludibacteraceae bacterium]